MVGISTRDIRLEKGIPRDHRLGVGNMDDISMVDSSLDGTTMNDTSPGHTLPDNSLDDHRLVREF